MAFNDTNSTTILQWKGFDVPRDLQIVMTTIYVITFVLALLGNILVIHAVAHYRHMRTTTNVLITNMAVADLLTTLFAMPYSVIYLYIQGRWFGGAFGSISCKVVHFVIAVTIAASIIALFMVSLERFCAVVYALKYIKVSHNNKLLSIIVWASSCAFMSIFLVVYRVNAFSDRTYICQLEWQPQFDIKDSPQVYYMLVFVLLYLLPLLAISFMHTKIIRRLWRRRIPGNRLALNRKAALRSRRSVIKMLGVVLVVFTLCWLPVHVMHIFINFDYIHFKKLSPWVVMLGFWVSHANSAINPYIFITMNQSFKKIALGVLTRRTMCSEPTSMIRRVSTGLDSYRRRFFSDFQGYSLTDHSIHLVQCSSPQVHLKTFTNMVSVPRSPNTCHGKVSQESKV